MHGSPGRTVPWPIWLGLVLALLAASCSGAGEAGFEVVDPSLETRIVVVPDKPPRPLERVVIHAVGDVLARADLAIGADKPLSGAAGLFTNDALTIANLACAAKPDEAAEDGPENVLCDRAQFTDVRTIGIDVVSVANDEAPLQGRRSLRTTIGAATDAGLLVVGGGTNDDEAYAPTIIEAGGWRIAVLAMTAIGSNFAEPDRAGVAAVERTEQAEAAVAAARENADLVIATVHWGRPLDRDPERRDRDYADMLIAAGVDAIVGHGPHRLQSFALVDNRPVFWSLGHFIWPVGEPADADSAIARLEIAPDGAMVTCMLPVTIDPARAPQLDRQDPDCHAQG